MFWSITSALYTWQFVYLTVFSGIFFHGGYKGLNGRQPLRTTDEKKEESSCVWLQTDVDRDRHQSVRLGHNPVPSLDSRTVWQSWKVVFFFFGVSSLVIQPLFLLMNLKWPKIPMSNTEAKWAVRHWGFWLVTTGSPVAFDYIRVLVEQRGTQLEGGITEQQIRLGRANRRSGGEWT